MSGFFKYLLLFAALCAGAFLLSSRIVVVYDEGLLLTGIMRVMAGQVPHRDFYFNYGAGTLYLFAGLFRLFGTSVLVERLAGIVTSSLLVLSIYPLTVKYTARWLALAATAVAWLWVTMDPIQGLGPSLACLLLLWSTWLIVPAPDSAKQQRRMFTAGLLIGLLFLLRYDLGVGVPIAHIAAVAAIALSGSQDLRNALRKWWRAMWPYAAGFAVVVAGPAIAYLRVAPLHDALYDVFLFQAKYYRRGRGLPLPSITFLTLPDCVVYVAPVVLVLALCLVLLNLTRRRREALNQTPLPESISLLIAFGIVATELFIKGIVRTGAGQMFPCTILCLVMLAIIAEHSKTMDRRARVACAVVALLLAFLGASTLQLKLLDEKHARSSTLRWILSPASHPPFPPFRNWCHVGAPITTGFCYLLDDDRIRTVEYLKSHTQSTDTIYVGLPHHDRIFVNDNLTYFAAQRLPATKWSHFDPFLQNRADIQQEMIADLERNKPPFVVLDTQFEGSHEPNGSSVSTGVHLLDDYIAAHYTFAVQFGYMTILRRNP